MKQVFTSREIAHVWAQQKQPSGRSAGNMSFDGTKFYSYRTVIAQFTPYKTADGTPIVLVADHVYSATTSHHQGFVRDALRGKYVRVLYVPQINEYNPTPMIEELQQRAWMSLRTIASGKIRADWKIREAIHTALGALGSASVLMHASTPKKDRNKQLLQRLDRVSELARAWPTSHEEDGKRYVSTSSGKGWVASVAELAEAWQAMDNNVLWQKGFSTALGDGGVQGVASLIAWTRRVGQPKPFYTMGKAMLAKALKKRAELLAALDTWFTVPRADAALRHIELVIDALDVREQYKQQLERMYYDNATHYVKTIEANVAAKHWGLVSRDYDETMGRCAAWPDLVERLNACAVAWDKHCEDNEKKWRAGEDVSMYNFRRTLLRVVDDVIETSRGARVPLDVAPTLWKLVQRVRSGKSDGAGMTMEVGHYTLNKVEPNGSLHIGCHRLAYEELARLAAQLGLSSTAETTA
jgi:hypothetical protein